MFNPPPLKRYHFKIATEYWKCVHEFSTLVCDINIAYYILCKDADLNTFLFTLSNEPMSTPTRYIRSLEKFLPNKEPLS